MGGHEKSGGGLVVEGSWERKFFFPSPACNQALFVIWNFLLATLDQWSSLDTVLTTDGIHALSRL
jgi:hypothetical protein